MKAKKILGFFSSVVNSMKNRISGHRRVGGVIFMTPSVNEELLRSITDSATPFVLLDSHRDLSDAYIVRMDEYEAGRLAGRHFAELGHRNCFCITGPWDLDESQQRLKGFRDTLARYSIELDERHIFKGDFESGSGQAAARFIIEKKLAVTALWAQNDLMAIGAMRELKRNGIRIPEEISIMGMDNTAQSASCNPRLTTIDQPVREMATKAMEMLLEIWDGKTDGRKEVIFRPKLIVRNSTRRLV
jgi:LacI family transcriptional regulator